MNVLFSMYYTGGAYTALPLGQSPVIAVKLLQNMLGTAVQELHEPLKMKPCTIQKQLFSVKKEN